MIIDFASQSIFIDENMISFHIIFIFWKYLKSSILQARSNLYAHNHMQILLDSKRIWLIKFIFLDVQATVEGARANIIFIIGNQNMLSRNA